MTAHLVTLCAALIACIVVASAPRTASAQTTAPAQHTVRHVLRADVGTITQTEISSPWRPSAAELSALVLDASLSARGVMQRADVRSNVRAVVMLESAASATGGDPVNGWRVLDANGQLVPWRGLTVPLSHELVAGRHTIPIVWVAPAGTSPSSPPAVRLRIVTDAR